MIFKYFWIFIISLILDLGLHSSQDEQEIIVSNPFLKTNISMNSEFEDPLEMMQAIDLYFKILMTFIENFMSQL